MAHRPPHRSNCNSFTNASLLLCIVSYLCVLRAQAEQQTPPSSETSAADVSNHAFRKFHLFLAGDDEPSQNKYYATHHDVFKDGKVQPGWIPKSKTMEYNISEPGLSPFHHDQYTDRVSFDFSYASFLNYDLAKPTVSALNDTIATPKVIDFQVDDEDYTGSFTIVYDCHRLQGIQVRRNVTVSLVFPIVSGLSLYFSMLKTCGGGRHEFVEFGYFKDSKNPVSEFSRVPFRKNSSILTVGPHVMTTRIYIHLYPPARSQEFFHVTTTTTSTNLVVHVRGPVFGGVVRSSESTAIHILYECHASGVYQVSLRIPIWPFQELVTSWKKDCGGGLASGLSVGSSLSKKDDIVYQAQARDIWKLALLTSGERISNQAPVVNTSIRYKDFWLSNNGTAVHVAPAVVTVENQAILAAYSSTPERPDSIQNRHGGGLLHRGGILRLHVRMICKKRGKTLVIVTFPIQSFANVDFGFVKQCRAPKRYIHSGFLRTAKSVTGLMSFLLAATIVCWWIMQLRAVGIGKAVKPSTAYRRV